MTEIKEGGYVRRKPRGKKRTKVAKVIGVRDGIAYLEFARGNRNSEFVENLIPVEKPEGVVNGK